jgi:hypothetical protein
MINMLRTAGIVLAAALVLLVACSKKKPTEPEPTEYEWVILGYFDGNNSEDEAPDGHSYVIRDVQELEEIGSTDQVKIVVMLGSFKTDGNCKYYGIQKHPGESGNSISSEVLQDLGKRDMSDPMTLRDFVGYGMENFRAKHYMLVVNDHGGGWRGLCSDTINGDGDWMSLLELSSALSGFQFDIIWFYAPSMATAEVAYQVRDAAEYLIASQFSEYPDNIMGSAEWLSGLTADPGMNVRLFARSIVEAKYKAAQLISPTKRVHSALIHLARIPQLADDLSKLSTDLIDSVGSYWSEVWDAWQLSSIEIIQADSGYVDLREFARQIQSRPHLNSVIVDDAQSLEISASDAVRLEKEYPTYSITGGISIHLPWNHDDFDSTSYAPLHLTETDWHAFISVFIQSFSTDYAGALYISSSPTGAKVFLDGVDTGYETNALIEGLYPRMYAIRLVKPGYQHDPDPFITTIYPRRTSLVDILLHPSP